MPTENPAPAIVSCVIETATLPVLVILVICVVAVFSACEPNPTLLGVAERLVEEGAGVGVGEGAGDPAADCAPPPPQPNALTMEMSKTTRIPTCTA